jgi:hypothetical protein
MGFDETFPAGFLPHDHCFSRLPEVLRLQAIPDIGIEPRYFERIFPIFETTFDFAIPDRPPGAAEERRPAHAAA